MTAPSGRDGHAIVRGRARLLAFYLPQFHPIPENDRWWGTGFTEWRNVARARPLFRGHVQPVVPGELGFYDLRLAEVQEEQAALAAEHLVEGFCVWHYWFGATRLLHRPVDQVLEGRARHFPFCLAWANEPWSRRWLGEENDVLQPQTYADQDDRDHARWLATAFASGQYLRVGNRPLFAIYAPMALPDARRTLDVVKSVVCAEGLPEPYLVAIDARSPGADYASLGFDATLNFEPQLSHLVAALDDGPRVTRLLSNLRRGVVSARLKVYDERDARARFAANRGTSWTHRSVLVGWDNTPRRGRDGIVLTGGSPASYRESLALAVDDAERRHAQAEERIVWINAWNEWAEGNHLEPDLRGGRGYLEATREVNRPRP